ncbi:MAG: hypothetical protein VW362_08070 [Candidatus Nanopelagicales bacterium]
MNQGELLDLIRKTYRDEFGRFTASGFRERTGKALDWDRMEVLIAKGIVIRVPLGIDDPRRSRKDYFEYRLA